MPVKLRVAERSRAEREGRAGGGRAAVEGASDEEAAARGTAAHDSARDSDADEDGDEDADEGTRPPPSLRFHADWLVRMCCAASSCALFRTNSRP